MRQKINSLLKTNSTMLNNLRIAELNALQAQINPHFIYNALAAVSWTAKLQKQPQIVKWYPLCPLTFGSVTTQAIPISPSVRS